MKALKLFTLLGSISLLAASCSTSMQMASSSAGDDIYFDPSQNASGQLATASNGKRVPMDKSYRDLLNETNRAMSDSLYNESDSTGNPYNDVLADSYEKARRNRELGQRDPWNGMSTNAAYSQNMWYATAYDPAFYNVIVMGNTIWAEPKYVSSMFGYPYYSPYVNFGAYYSPWRNNWNYSFNWGFGWGNNWGWGYNGWYDPYWGGYYGWGYDPYWGGGYHHGWGSYWNDYPYYNYPSYGGRYNREVVYGPRNGSRYTGRSDVNRDYPSRSYSREAISTDRTSYNYSRENSRGSVSSRGDMSREAGRTQSTTYYTSRRPSSVSQSRPISNDYTPTYSRPARTSQPAFNDGNRGGGQTYERRPSAVVGPRSERSYEYTPSRGNTNSSYTPSRSTDYSPSRSSSNYNSSRGSGSYTPPSSGSTGRDNSGSSRGGGRR